jgi:hypothetical protein
MSKRSGLEYTVKDITQKNADIKKIFREICPERFPKAKPLKYFTTNRDGNSLS